MGKDLKGKDLGPGVMQRKDGRNSGRYTGADGKKKIIRCLFPIGVKLA